jgi:hypothetical protein
MDTNNEMRRQMKYKYHTNEQNVLMQEDEQVRPRRSERIMKMNGTPMEFKKNDFLS